MLIEGNYLCVWSFSLIAQATDSSAVDKWVVPVLSASLAAIVSNLITARVKDWKHSKAKRRQREKRATRIATLLIAILDELKAGEQYVRATLEDDDILKAIHAFDRGIYTAYRKDLHTELNYIHLSDIEIFPMKIQGAWLKLTAVLNTLLNKHQDLRTKLQNYKKGDDMTRTFDRLRNYHSRIAEGVAAVERTLDALAPFVDEDQENAK